MRLKNKDLAVIGIIFLYCALFALFRILVSQSMELDEAEQFLKGSFFSFGYSNQPPLYSWIIKGMSSLFGLNIITLIATKYTLIFFFYLTFYRIARLFWDSHDSLIIMSSLMLFPVYAYEFNRDLSHSVSVSLMASVALYLYIRILDRQKAVDYCLFGIFCGLGILSKYNFLFFLLALILTSISNRGSYSAILNKKITVSITSFFLVLLPHLIWLIHEDFQNASFAINKAQAWKLGLTSLPGILVSSYLQIGIFLFIFFIFFATRFSLRTGDDKRFMPLRWCAFYGLMIPCAVIVLMQPRHFSERWLAPLLFLFPLAFFSLIDTGANKKRMRVLGGLCLFTALSILIARTLIGFYPDETGKVERIHIPYREVSLKLGEELRRRNVRDFHDVLIVSDNEHLAANIMAFMPGARFQSISDLEKGDLTGKAGLNKAAMGVLIWDVSKRGADIPENFKKLFPSAIEIKEIEAEYLHARSFPPYILGASIVSSKERVSEKSSGE
jgi:4-amino-4-deoxy-L-arabinose transferase-like glycosyltransferase